MNDLTTTTIDPMRLEELREYDAGLIALGASKEFRVECLAALYLLDRPAADLEVTSAITALGFQPHDVTSMLTCKPTRALTGTAGRDEAGLHRVLARRAPVN